MAARGDVVSDQGIRASESEWEPEVALLVKNLREVYEADALTVQNSIVLTKSDDPASTMNDYTIKWVYFGCLLVKHGISDVASYLPVPLVKKVLDAINHFANIDLALAYYEDNMRNRFKRKFHTYGACKPFYLPHVVYLPVYLAYMGKFC